MYYIVEHQFCNFCIISYYCTLSIFVAGFTYSPTRKQTLGSIGKRQTLNEFKTKFKLPQIPNYVSRTNLNNQNLMLVFSTLEVYYKGHPANWSKNKKIQFFLVCWMMGRNILSSFDNCTTSNTNTTLVPVYHALLIGVLILFQNVLLKPFSKAKRNCLFFDKLVLRPKARKK